MVLGGSGSGKTTAIEILIDVLTRRGYRVGAAKHTHHPGFTVDTEGKDSWRFSKAGARAVVMVSPREVAVIRRPDRPIGSMDALIELLGKDLDILLVEGFQHLSAHLTGCDKIVTATSEESLRKTLSEVAPEVLAVVGIIASFRQGKTNEGIPIFNLFIDAEKLVDILKSRMSVQRS